MADPILNRIIHYLQTSEKELFISIFTSSRKQLLNVQVHQLPIQIGQTNKELEEIERNFFQKQLQTLITDAQEIAGGPEYIQTLYPSDHIDHVLLLDVDPKKKLYKSEEFYQLVNEKFPTYQTIKYDFEFIIFDDTTPDGNIYGFNFWYVQQTKDKKKRVIFDLDFNELSSTFF